MPKLPNKIPCEVGTGFNPDSLYGKINSIIDFLASKEESAPEERHNELKYHAGEWHYLKCNFPEVDYAVCNCPIGLKPKTAPEEKKCGNGMTGEINKLQILREKVKELELSDNYSDTFRRGYFKAKNDVLSLIDDLLPHTKADE